MHHGYRRDGDRRGKDRKIANIFEFDIYSGLIDLKKRGETMRKLLWVAFMCAVLVLGISAQEKKYEDIVGSYEFDQEGQIMAVSFWVEDGQLWGGPEGEEAAVLEPVEGKPLHFEVNADGQVIELEFIKDDSGKVVKCIVLTMGMEMEGVKIKK